MTEFVWLVVGLLIGACIAVAILCYLQVERNCSYEQEIRRLKDESRYKNGFGSHE